MPDDTTARTLARPQTSLRPLVERQHLDPLRRLRTAAFGLRYWADRMADGGWTAPGDRERARDAVTEFDAADRAASDSLY